MVNGNREALLQSGLKLFSSSGYVGVSVQEIVDQAGVSKPTLYHYFGSKLSFYAAIFDVYGESLLGLLQEKCRYSGDLVHHLNTLTQSLLDYFLGREDFFWFLENAYSAPMQSEYEPIVSGFWDALQAPLLDFFEQAANHHGNLRGKAMQLTYTYLGMVRIFFTLIMRGKVERTGDLSYRLMHQFMYGIFS